VCDALGSERLTQEVKDFVAWRARALRVAKPVPAAAPVSAPPPPTAESANVKCKHFLKTFETQHAGFNCDECRSRIPPKTLLHGCRVCNYDVCGECLHCARPAAEPVPTPAVVSAPQAKFVCDVTLADGSVVRPFEKLEKTWRIRNSGEDVWPAGSRIVHVGGDLLGGPVHGKEVGSVVRPGEMINLSVDLVMPSIPGRYTSYWRLTTPHPTNTRFGHRFWVTVTVIPPVASAFPNGIQRSMMNRPMPPPPPPPTVQDDGMLAVAQVVEFGFNDVEKIVAYLKQEGGDIGKVIDRLLQEDQ